MRMDALCPTILLDKSDTQMGCEAINMLFSAMLSLGHLMSLCEQRAAPQRHLWDGVYGS